ncbi:thiamine phosphate synthase [Thermodesulfobacteriota bacterium]
MRIILISPPDYIEYETSLVNRMFEDGLVLFHLRKPGYNRERLSVYLNKINREYHPRIVIHSCYELLGDYNLRGIHIRAADKELKESIIERYKSREDLSISISCHTLNELADDTSSVDYAFLSPVFDSISKSSYKAGFDHRKLADTLERLDLDVVALGGCRAEYLRKIKQLGFTGAAFLGAVWNSPDPVASYLSINNYHLSMINE